MRVLKSGLTNNKGITITCRSCYCVYTIEDRSDWTGRWIYDRMYLTDVYEYGCKCPECGHSEYFGIDHRDRPEFSIRNPIFNRNDWEERYKVVK